MRFILQSKVPKGEPLPGWQGFARNSQAMSFVQYDIAAGASIHQHHHAKEEVWIVVDEKLEVTLDGETRVVGPGDAVLIAGATRHIRCGPSPKRGPSWPTIR